MAGFLAPKKLENHTSEGSMRKGEKEKVRRKKEISTLAEKKKKGNCSTEELYSARYTFMLLFAEDLLAPSSTHTNKQFF